MPSFKLAYGFFIFLLVNCQNNSQNNNSNSNSDTASISLEDNEFIYFINSYKVYCVGVAPQMCLQIQKGDKIVPGTWQMFYGYIHSFDWEPGFIYQIVVRENKIPAGQVSADASDIQYTFVRQIYKKKDPAIRLHDIWALESILGKSIEEFKPEEQPTLEIKLSMGQVMGTDGCNNYKGKIQQVHDGILRISPLVTTRKACQHMDLPDLFQRQMEKVDGYSLNQLILTLKDKERVDLMTFRKVD